MSSCDMQGFATSNDLHSLYRELKLKTKEERANDKFALFVVSRGMLNGEEALQYLEEKFNKAD